MMTPEELTVAAQSAPPKVDLQDYREAVVALREKGYSWREVADFLNERGVATDHTRLYRLFGEKHNERKRESREVDIKRMTYVGQRQTKKRNAWNVMEIELPSKLGKPIIVQGFAWGTGAPRFGVGANDALSFRDATLVTRSSQKGFPMAYLQAEIQIESGEWVAQEVYIAPKWEVLL